MDKKGKAVGKQQRSKQIVWVNMLYVLVSLAVILLLWRIVSTPGMKSAKVFASPAAVLEAFLAKVKTGKIWEHLGYSIGRVLVGFFAGFCGSRAVRFPYGMV